VASPLDAVDVGLTIKMTPVPGSARTTILLTAEPYSVSLEPNRDRFHGRFDVRFVQFAADAQPKQDFTDEVILNLDHRDAQRTAEEGFHYTREIELHQDARILKVAFCDRGTGRLGSIRLALDLPPALDPKPQYDLRRRKGVEGEQKPADGSAGDKPLCWLLSPALVRQWCPVDPHQP